MRLKTIFLLLSLLLTTLVYAEKNDSIKLRQVNLVLGDTTANDAPLFLVLKIKVDDKEPLIFSAPNFLLFEQFFSPFFEWDGVTYIEKIRPYLMEDMPFPITLDQVDYFVFQEKRFATISECECLFNNEKEDILIWIKYLDFSFFENRTYMLTCLMYNSFKYGLVANLSEQGIEFKEVDEYRLRNLLRNE